MVMTCDYSASNSASFAGFVRSAFSCSISGDNFLRVFGVRSAPLYIPQVEGEVTPSSQGAGHAIIA